MPKMMIKKKDGKERMRELIKAECANISNMLLDKNESYGNSVCTPCNIFSPLSPEDQLNVRIDDKLNRIMNGREYGQEDTELDLIGYLILKRCVTAYLERGDDYSDDELFETIIK